MNGEGPNKPTNLDEESRIMDKHMGGAEYNVSRIRDEKLSRFRSRTQLKRAEAAFHSYEEALVEARANLEAAREGAYPPEWKIDLEKAERIESEIRQKLAELNELFKLD